MKRTSALTFNVTSPQSQLPTSGITSISPPLIKVQKRKQNPKVLSTLQPTPTSTSTESSSSLSHQEVLSELRRYEVICREQSLQLALLSNQLTDLKTVYNFEMAQSQQMWKALIEKDQLVEYQRNLVIYLQRKILSMEYQQQEQQSQDHLNSNDAVVTSGSPKFRPEQKVQGTRAGSLVGGAQHVDIPNHGSHTDLMSVFCSHSDKNSYSNNNPHPLQRSGNYQPFGFSPHIFPADTISSSVSGLRSASHPFSNSSNDNSTHLMNRFGISPDHSSSSSDNLNPWQQFPNFQQFGNQPHVFSPDVISPPMSRIDESVSQLHKSINEKNSDLRPVPFSRANNSRVANASQEIEEMRSSLSYTDVTKAGIDNESDGEIDVVGAYSPSPIPFEHSDSTSAPAVVSESSTNGKSIESTSGTVGSNIPDHTFLSPVEEVADYAFRSEVAREPMEELRREIDSLLNDDNKDGRSEISSVLLHGSQLSTQPEPANHSAPSCHQIASKLVAAIEITPLKFSKCGTTLTYTSLPMTTPSTTPNIDLSSLNWKPFDETTVGCNNAEKGVPHASGYAIVKVDRIQHLPFRNAHPSNTADSSCRAKPKYKTKNPNANYVARIREEAFLEDGQKVYNVDYMKMSKTSTYNPNSKIGKSSTFKFTAYTTADDQRSYLCFQQDVLFYLPEPKETRRGKLSFANFDFEPYNLHD